MTPLHILEYQHLPIFEQLQLEEALLRNDTRNWCLINRGSPPAIVMGISGQSKEHIHEEKNPFPIIRRFSGGGTVVVDENTLFISLIINQEEIAYPCYPEIVLKWVEGFFLPAFKGRKFRLLENDFVMGSKKFGGNAQHLTRKRCVYHTSLLWDFDQAKMDLLKMPPKMPTYRKKREHQDFLCSLKEVFTSQEELINPFLTSLSHRFQMTQASHQTATEALLLPHRKSTICF